MKYRKNKLEELAERYAPSKLGHNYYQHYWTHFRDVANEVKSVCEIGVATGGSLRVWRDFFPNATIHGIDINPECKKCEEDRINVHIGSQVDQEFLSDVVKSSGGSFDIIIDDGSHIPQHQINTFNALFWSLSEHGIYVIEDTGSVVGDFQNSAINAIRNLTDSVNYWPPNFDPRHWSYLGSFPEETPSVHKMISGLSFYRWIAFVFKGNNPGDNPYLRTPKDLAADLASGAQTFSLSEATAS